MQIYHLMAYMNINENVNKNKYFLKQILDIVLISI